MIPEQSLNAQIAQITRQKTVFEGVIVLLALLAGILFAAVILKPIGFLSTATKSIAGGDLAARVRADHTDELGQLGRASTPWPGGSKPKPRLCKEGTTT